MPPPLSDVVTMRRQALRRQREEEEEEQQEEEGESEGEVERCGCRTERDGGFDGCILPFGHDGPHDLGLEKRQSRRPPRFIPPPAGQKTLDPEAVEWALRPAAEEEGEEEEEEEEEEEGEEEEEEEQQEGEGGGRGEEGGGGGQKMPTEVEGEAARVRHNEAGYRRSARRRAVRRAGAVEEGGGPYRPLRHGG